MANHNLQINPNNLDDVKCDSCQCPNFSPWLRIKELPALLSPDGTPGTVNMQVGFVCLNCGKLFSIMDLATMSKIKAEEEASKLVIVGGHKNES
jgi:hypothetical protein